MNYNDICYRVGASAFFTLAIWGLSCYTERFFHFHDFRIAIVIPGGGLTSSGECPPHTKLRIEKAFSLYMEKKILKKDVCIITLSGGTPYKPNPVDNNGFPISEATAASKMLIAMGVPFQDILEEAFSLDTIGNVRIWYSYC